MFDAIAGLPEQSLRGYEEGLRVPELPDAAGVTAVAFCGMGSSAVAGDVVRSVFRGELRVPVQVIREPELPDYVGPGTLVVCSSYSGGTAETLSCFDQSIARGARVVAVTSGGELAERARARRVPLAAVPAAFVVPRASFGALSFTVLGVLEAAGLLPGLREDVAESVAVLGDLAGRLDPQIPSVDNEAKRVALRIGDRFPVVWGAEGFPAVAAVRWKTQLNENAKLPAFASAMPELDHNEVVGWARGAGERFFVVELRTESESADVAARFPLSEEIALEAGVEAQQVHAVGRSSLARLCSLVVVGDFASVYLGLRRGYDPTPIDAIDRLKAALADG
jgi:glucose/mannose-6-phosphate isomerase